MALEQYVPIAIFVVLALLFPIGTFLATRFIRPHHPTPLKLTTYECGEEPEGEANIQFHFQYYTFALIFASFDIAAAFLLLWAMAFTPESDLLSRAAVLAFVGILTGAVLYALKKEEVIAI